jgi:phage tail sheath protein FI
MPILQQVSANTTALIVPDLYVQIVPPRNLVLNGVPTDVVGIVGTSSWGPVNQPVVASSMSDYAANFGPIMARKYDMGTQMATAVQQGAQNFRCVRVTDGTDTAAQLALFASGTQSPLTLTARYTGSYGNQISGAFSPGSQPNTWRISVSLPGLAPEVFDNIGGIGPTFWQNVVNAINLGQNLQRGPSQILLASLGTSLTTMPTAGLFSFASGTPGSDGAGNVTSATLIGQNATPRTGMYCLRGQGCSLALLADADDSTQWVTQAAFGLSEGIYMILTGPSGDTIANAVATKQAVGLDSYAAKLMFGDWIWWNDQANGVTRLVSPQGFVAGRLANLSPEQSSLNKPLYGVVGTQKSGTPGTAQNNVYSEADLQALFSAGIDVIANPQPGGAFWGVRCGHNSSSQAATNGDNYTRLTNYIAASLSAGMGQYVGEVISVSLFQSIRATLTSFFQNMLNAGMLGSADGSVPFQVICDTSNNPVTRTALGYVQADCQVQYLAINEKFIVNVEGGQTVIVQHQTLPSGQIGT